MLTRNMFFLQKCFFWKMLILVLLKSHGTQSQNILAKLAKCFSEKIMYSYICTGEKKTQTLDWSLVALSFLYR